MASLASSAIFAAFRLVVGNTDQTTALYIDDGAAYPFNIIHVIRNAINNVLYIKTLCVKRFNVHNVLFR